MPYAYDVESRSTEGADTEATEELSRSIRDGVRTANLGRDQRVAFYPVGAAMALLLDEAAPDWKHRHFGEPFQLDTLFRIE